MGEVYLAFDVRLDRRVVVKALTRSDARERMLREARAMSALRHPGIVTVYDIGEHRGRTFIAMEYVEGQTFSAIVNQRGRLPPDEAVSLIAQLARIIHHDVERDQAARGRSGRTPGSAARIVLDVLDEREPAVRHEMPAPRRSQPAAW